MCDEGILRVCRVSQSTFCTCIHSSQHAVTFAAPFHNPPSTSNRPRNPLAPLQFRRESTGVASPATKQHHADPRHGCGDALGQQQRACDRRP